MQGYSCLYLDRRVIIRSLHVAPHGKSPELRDYISVCLVMESKKQSDVCSTSMDATHAPTSLIPARFRCSLLDQKGRIAHTNGEFWIRTA
ncbi:unnamed protein product [Hymenolepis diminuta]|uniref:Uncharacterized protein n=1 Tax=Hymenolepis diminuta TaxID=6216 RepID=A0A0R3SY30_HYMDI|nr:unnamed protein product [Hymenolepis diminuta]